MLPAAFALSARFSNLLQIVSVIHHFLAELSGKVISAANIEYYARLAKEKYLYRRMTGM